jgi:chorismate--pyruvate lyase
LKPLQSKADSNLLSGILSLEVPNISDSNLDWHSEGERRSLPADAWRRWLFDPSSLTKLLISKSDGNFRVEVCEQEWLRLPNPEVRSCFGPLAADHKFWSRKVVLVGDNTPWVLAHTLIPQFSLTGPLKRVLQLNEKPLGEYLFSHPDLIRSGIDITPIAEDSWGRRSLFYLFGKPIMVAEFFLPAILD